MSVVTSSVGEKLFLLVNIWVQVLGKIFQHSCTAFVVTRRRKRPRSLVGFLAAERAMLGTDCAVI